MTIKHLYPNSIPALNLNFKSSRVADPRLACVRASVATYVDPVSGLIKTAAANEARVEKGGLLIEEERTNLILFSEPDTRSAFNTVGEWNFIDLDPTTEITKVTGPDGVSNSASEMQLATGTNNDAYAYQLPVTVGQPYSVSAWVKLGTATNFTLHVNDTLAWASIPEGVKTFDASDGLNTSSFTKVGVSFTAPASGKINIHIGRNVVAASQEQQTSGTVTAWGFQCELGAFSTSTILTNGSTVQRLADAITLTNSSIFNPNENTIINEDFGVAGGSDTLTVVGDGEVAKRTAVYNSNLTQEQINTLTGTDEWWEWRVLGDTFGLNAMVTDGVVEVDWGDGSPIENTFNGISHTFTNGAGYHTIKFRMVSGTYFAPKIGNKVDYRDAFISTGPAPENMEIDFPTFAKSCTNFKTLDPTIKVRPFSFQEAFENSGLLSFPFMDTAGVASFTRAFSGCNKITSFPVIDTSSSLGFDSAWQNCNSLISFPALDMSSSSTFVQTWYQCSSLESFPVIDCSSADNFYRTWRGCSGLTSFPLIDTSSVTNFIETWHSCTGLTSFPSIDTSAATNLDFTWYNCNQLTSFPSIDTSSCTTFREAWRVCSSLTSFPVIDVSSAASSQDFYMTWRECSSLTAFPALDFTSGQIFYFCWGGCTDLVTFPAGCWDNWSPTTVRDNCFEDAWDGCSSLSATSVENILNSIDTSGQSAPSIGPDIHIDYNASSGTPNISTAVTNLKSRGWTITLNNVAQ